MLTAARQCVANLIRERHLLPSLRDSEPVPPRRKLRLTHKGGRLANGPVFFRVLYATLPALREDRAPARGGLGCRVV